MLVFRLIAAAGDQAAIVLDPFRMHLVPQSRGRADGLSCGDCDRSRLGINAARFRTLRDLCSSAPLGGALTRGV